MIAALRRLLLDENYFSQKLRAVVGMVGMLFISGVLRVPDLPPRLQWLSYLIGLGFVTCAFWVRSGDVTPPAARALAAADPEKLAALLRQVGVSDHTIAEAVTKPPE